MTLHDACEGVNAIYRDCIDNAGLWGKILGRCDDLKFAFDACMKKEFEKVRLENKENAKKRMSGWKERNAELGLGTPGA
ncbi:hypothetical protein BDK51DRAFT_50326 [Blyttiomyces helicus]|uniref:COX assembly mitochondrial protein n=1 Tax=Blyttiomyces helicus TaxID=388810 RepID=A0A4P9WEH3_9FUNG|nr:hypothetical protein BDK51DRAFT_50326 [Blyttiomyces helicus]|eukprot:RKO89668.1 hypothetical protein BDK51DRAFT_50326 [Blyttiomyces helicus]